MPSSATAPARTDAPTHRSGQPPSRTRAPRRIMGMAALVVAVAIIVAASLAVGTRSIAPGAVLSALSGDGDPSTVAVVTALRVPRTLLGLLAGAGLGVGGALIQAVTRNPLADPGLLGVNAGASFAVVTGVWLLGVTGATGQLWLALVGAFVTTLGVALLAGVGGRRSTPARLTLAGAAVMFFLFAGIRAVTLIDTFTLDEYRFWVVGSLVGRDMTVISRVAPVILLGLVLAVALAGALNALALGEDSARTLGTRVGTVRLAALVAITLLCGGATAACGPIAFVGLVIPHVLRTWFGPDQRWLVPAAALAGPVLLLAADILGRVVARPDEVRVGVMVAAIGGPAFVALVRRSRMAEL